jgi:hypothetical protein
MILNNIKKLRLFKRISPYNHCLQRFELAYSVTSLASKRNNACDLEVDIKKPGVPTGFLLAFSDQISE